MIDRRVRCPLVKTFEELWDELAAKAAQGASGSRTVELIEAGVHEIGKKVVEEAAEAWMAAEYEGADRAAEEIAQLIYHAQVLMLAKGLGLADLYRHL
jgi:phosphoribosyl-ATP pyrophosphohydrolase